MNQRTQNGSILLPAVIVVLIVVIAGLWMAGIIGTGGSPQPEVRPTPATPASASGQPTNPAEQASTTDAQDAPDVQPTALSASELAAKRAREFKPQLKRSGNAFELVAEPQTPADSDVRDAATALLANNQPDFSACNGLTPPEKALECAASEQTKALNAAFAAHNELRSSGDSISIERGGQIMQVVIETMQQSLEPYVRAADAGAR